MQPQSAVTTQEPALLLMVPPPLLFAAAFGAGALVHHFVPLSLPPVFRGAGLVDAVILAAGIGLGAWLAVGFLMRRTTLKPFADPAVLVTSGPYRLSRNPMYLSLIVTYAGAALMFGSAWPWLCLVVPVVAMTQVVIPFEESRMQAVFGTLYRGYQARVRRWL